MTSEAFSFLVKTHDASRSEMQLVAGKDFRLDLSNLGVISDIQADLLRLASAVFFADRLVVRPKGWGRRLVLRVSVCRRDLWEHDAVQEILQEIVGDILGGDRWEFQFQDGQPTPRQALLRLREHAAASRVCLYSGGLDSAAGFSARLRQDESASFLPVTVMYAPRISRIVGDQLSHITHVYKQVQSALTIRAALISPPPFKRQEHSQRCRSLLFAVAGGVAAQAIGSGVVELFESGIGAINFPLERGMGSRATRGCNPRLLARIGNLFRLVTGSEVLFKLPFLSRTKAEIIESLRLTGLTNLSALTASCVQYPLRAKQKHCGSCPACLLRSQALFTAGIREPDGFYRDDLFGDAKAVNAVPQSRLEYLKQVLWQVENLAVAGSKGDSNALLCHFRRAGVDDVRCAADLYARYHAEWRSLIIRGQELGWKWARLVSVPQKVA